MNKNIIIEKPEIISYEIALGIFKKYVKLKSSKEEKKDYEKDMFSLTNYKEIIPNIYRPKEQYSSIKYKGKYYHISVRNTEQNILVKISN